MFGNGFLQRAYSYFTNFYELINYFSDANPNNV